MPVLEASNYAPPLLLRSGHLQTIYPSLVRRVRSVLPFTRSRIETPDADFLDLDWIEQSGDSIVVLSHGLEGSSRSHYIGGMANAFLQRGWSVLSWNMRGCSGEPNRTLPWYHSGKSEDLDCVIRHVLETRRPKNVILVGFSVGGNITLKYLGEWGKDLPSEVKGAVTFSVPCDLTSSAAKMAQVSNRLYMKHFMTSFHRKLRLKMELFPGKLSDRGFSKIRTFAEYDERYTAPLNGYRSAVEYWKANSSLPLLSGITIPTLMVNARNDSFLSLECFPVQVARTSQYLFLEMPRCGGHAGFMQRGESGMYWSEERAVQFVEGILHP